MKKVLVIEDDTILRKELLEILTFEAYEVIGAANGRDGILLAQHHQPHLIISDVNMPDTDGFGVITGLRQNPQTASIPVVLLSAQNQPDIIEHGLQLGAVAYLTKPYVLKELLTTISKHISD